MRNGNAYGIIIGRHASGMWELLRRYLHTDLKLRGICGTVLTFPHRISHSAVFHQIDVDLIFEAEIHHKPGLISIPKRMVRGVLRRIPMGGRGCRRY